MAGAAPSTAPQHWGRHLSVWSVHLLGHTGLGCSCGGSHCSGGTAWGDRWGTLVRSHSWVGANRGRCPRGPHPDHTGQAGSHWVVLVQECSWGDTHWGTLGRGRSPGCAPRALAGREGSQAGPQGASGGICGDRKSVV